MPFCLFSRRSSDFVSSRSAPMAFSFVYSFQDYKILTGESTWQGLKNYKDLFTHILYSKSFFTSILNTLVLLLSIPCSMALGLCLAGLLRMGEIKGSKVFPGPVLSARGFQCGGNEHRLEIHLQQRIRYYQSFDRKKDPVAKRRRAYQSGDYHQKLPQRHGHGDDSLSRGYARRSQGLLRSVRTGRSGESKAVL